MPPGGADCPTGSGLGVHVCVDLGAWVLRFMFLQAVLSLLLGRGQPALAICSVGISRVVLGCPDFVGPLFYELPLMVTNPVEADFCLLFTALSSGVGQGLGLGRAQ